MQPTLVLLVHGTTTASTAQSVRLGRAFTETLQRKRDVRGNPAKLDMKRCPPEYPWSWFKWLFNGEKAGRQLMFVISRI